MFWFSFASLTPAVLIALACLWGGAWAYAALVAMTLAAALLDRFTDLPVPPMDSDHAERAGTRLSVLLAGVHFLLLALGVLAIAGSPRLAWTEAAALALALGLYLGQVSHPNAHELIHRPGRGLRRLGSAIYTSMLFGHHASAHPKVHHVHVATPDDPNSPRPGEGFWRFLPRAWIGSFRAGLAAERRDRDRHTQRRGNGATPYPGYFAGALAVLTAAAALRGWGGVGVLLFVAGYAQVQLLLADYVQHYGLRRAMRDTGRPEPVGPQHSWNAPHWYSASMMLNAPRHSDHHLHPGRCFPALCLDPERMPQLPYAMPVMCVIALFPPIWRGIMDPLAAQWRRREWPERA